MHGVTTEIKKCCSQHVRNTVLNVTEMLYEIDRNRLRNTTESLINYLCTTPSVFPLCYEYETEK